jgi:hypothetical protein
MLAVQVLPTADLRTAMADCVFHKHRLSSQSSSDQKQALVFSLVLVQQALATGSVFPSPLLSSMAKLILKVYCCYCLSCFIYLQ